LIRVLNSRTIYKIQAPHVFPSSIHLSGQMQPKSRLVFLCQSGKTLTAALSWVPSFLQSIDCISLFNESYLNFELAVGWFHSNSSLVASADCGAGSKSGMGCSLVIPFHTPPPPPPPPPPPSNQSQAESVTAVRQSLEFALSFPGRESGVEAVCLRNRCQERNVN
jgi:hypothetical protein